MSHVFSGGDWFLAPKSNRGRLPIRVTNAEASHEEESASRQRQYLILMGIRTACLFLAFFTHGWLRWTFAAGMIFLPWIAVVIANEVRRRREGDSENMLDVPPAEELGSAPEPAEADAEEPDVVMGEIVNVLDPAPADPPPEAHKQGRAS